MVLNRLLGQATGAVNEMTGQAQGSERGSKDTLEAEDFTWYGDNLVAGEYVDLAVFTVPAQTAYNVGYGTAKRPENQGRWFATFDDGAGNAVTGQVRIETRNANDKNKDTEISGVSTSRLDSDASDYRKQYPVPEILETPKTGEDSKIVVQFKLSSGSAGTAIDEAVDATVFQLDATDYS